MFPKQFPLDLTQLLLLKNMLDPVGAIGSFLSAAADGIGRIFGREPKKEKDTPKRRFFFGAVYLLFLLGGIALIIFVVHQIYFEK